jgi:hypothetical protein
VKPSELCFFCKPGIPCPECVKYLGPRAWELAEEWLAAEKKPTTLYQGNALKDQRATPREDS